MRIATICVLLSLVSGCRGYTPPGTSTGTPTPTNIAATHTADVVLKAIESQRTDFCWKDALTFVSGPRYFGGLWLAECSNISPGVIGQYNCVVVRDSTLEIVYEDGDALQVGMPLTTQEVVPLTRCSAKLVPH